MFSPWGHQDQGRRPQLLCWVRTHFSHLRVMALELWVWPWSCGFGLLAPALFCVLSI